MIRKPLKQTANSALKHLRLLQHNDKTMTGRCQHSDVKSKKVWMDAQFEMPETGKLNNSGRKKEQLHPGRWSCCNPSIFMVSLSVGKALFCKCSGHASLLGVIVRVIVRRKSNFFVILLTVRLFLHEILEGGFHHGNFKYCFFRTEPFGYSRHRRHQCDVDDFEGRLSGQTSGKTLFEKIK